MINHVQHSEILNTINKTGLRNCSTQGRAEYSFDNHCKGYILNLIPGQIAVPRTVRDSLDLSFSFILLQIFIYPGKLITIEFLLSDSENVRRRLIFTHGRQIIRNPIHARIPISPLNRNIWTDICFDLKSLFSLCFPRQNFRSIEGIFVSGTAKLRKIIALGQHADNLLPGISEMPKFRVVSQTIDASLYPQQTPKYYSSSPVKTVHKEFKKNIFKNSDFNIREISMLKREHMVRENIGPRMLFRSPKLQKIVEKAEKKIENFEELDDKIEENIEISRNSWEEQLMVKLPSKGYEEPEYFIRRCAEVCCLRHETPPIVHSKDGLVYDSFHRSYENL